MDGDLGDNNDEVDYSEEDHDGNKINESDNDDLFDDPIIDVGSKNAGLFVCTVMFFSFIYVCLLA